MKAKLTTTAEKPDDITRALLKALRAELLKKRQHLHKFGVTRRKDKSHVYGSYRDAVDTGSLMRNITIDHQPQSGQWTFSFNSLYATQVFGQRPELTAALEAVIVEAFGEALAAAVVLAEIDDWFD